MALDDRGLSFPLELGPDRGLLTFDLQDSVRAMLEQILFTGHGERVNRPTFGVGAMDLVFEPNSPFLESRLRLALQENVNEHLSGRIDVLGLEVSRDEEELHFNIAFQVRGVVNSKDRLELTIPLGVG